MWTLPQSRSTPRIMTSRIDLTAELSQLKSYDSSLPDDDEVKETNLELIDILETLQTGLRQVDPPVPVWVPLLLCKSLNLLGFSTHCFQMLISLLSMQLAYAILMITTLFYLLMTWIRLRLLGKLMIWPLPQSLSTWYATMSGLRYAMLVSSLSSTYLMYSQLKDWSQGWMLYDD